MFDHLLGRPPSPGYRRIQVLLIIFFWILRLAYGSPHGPRFMFIARANKALQRFSPWQLIVGTLTFIFALRQWDVLLGLSAPEPLARLYSRSYYRAAWIATGLDAGFATAMSIKPKWLRDLSSVVFSVYYILYTSKGEETLRKFRAVCTVEMLRATWNKTVNPYLRALTFWDRPSLPIVKRLVLSRPSDSSHTKPIIAWLFYSRSERELRFASDLILDFPGGGFVTMSPQHHEERLRRWAQQTGRPVISIEYCKAPEYPYPYAIEECFDAYRVLVRSKGQVIGMSGQSLNIVMSGDSAGGNICCNVMFKILESEREDKLTSIPHPVAIVLNYGALDFGFTSWMSPAQLSILRAEHLQSSSHIIGLASQKDHFSHKSPLAVVSDVNCDTAPLRRISSKRQKSWTTTMMSFKSGANLQEDVANRGSQRKVGKKKSFSLRFHDLEEGNVADTESADAQTSEGPSRHTTQLNSQSTSQKQSELGTTPVAKRPFETRLTMTSRVGYFQDKIISPSMMRAMAILYVGPHQNPDFETDYKLSPVLAPNTILEQFPPVMLMCGEKDPFVDDSVIFAGRLREAKRARRFEIQQTRKKRTTLGDSLEMTSIPKSTRKHSDLLWEERLLQESDDDWVTLEIIEGWSHGYLQMTSLMPEARDAIEHLAEWMEEIFVNHGSKFKGESIIKAPALDIDATASSETELEEPLTFVPKNRRGSSYTRNRDDIVSLSSMQPVPPDTAASSSNSAMRVHSIENDARSTRARLGRTSLLTAAAPIELNNSHKLTQQSLLPEQCNTRPTTPGMISVKEADLMKRRRLDAVIGMEKTETTQSPM